MRRLSAKDDIPQLLKAQKKEIQAQSRELRIKNRQINEMQKEIDYLKNQNEDFHRFLLLAQCLSGVFTSSIFKSEIQSIFNPKQVLKS